MAIQTLKPKRVFVFNKLNLPDPNPNLSCADAIEFLALEYPELVNAVCDQGEYKTNAKGDPELHYKVETKITQKG